MSHLAYLKLIQRRSQGVTSSIGTFARCCTHPARSIRFPFLASAPPSHWRLPLHRLDRCLDLKHTKLRNNLLRRLKLFLEFDLLNQKDQKSCRREWLRRRRRGRKWLGMRHRLRMWWYKLIWKNISIWFKNANSSEIIDWRFGPSRKKCSISTSIFLYKLWVTLIS